MPLLALLFLAASAAAPASEQDAARAARTALDRGDSASAEKIINDALTRFAKRDSEAVWALRVLRADVMVVRGQYAAALKELAFELPPKFRRSETAVRQLLTRASAQARMDDKSVGETIEAAKALATAHQPAMLAYVYIAKANTAPSPQAREKYAREAIALARKHGQRVMEATAMGSLAFMLVGQQRYAEAIEVGEKARSLADELQLYRLISPLEGNLGWAYIEIGDYEMAAELFGSAEANAARIGDVDRRVAWLNQLGNIRAQARDWEGVIRYDQQALSLGRPLQHRQLGFVLANMARASIELRRFDDARRYNAEALEWKRANKDENAELESYIVDARIATVTGEPARAEKLLREVVRETKKKTTLMEAESRLAQLYALLKKKDLATTHFESAVAAAREARKEITGSELRLSFFSVSEEMFDAYVDFLASNNRTEDALAVTETSRAASLEEALGVSTARIDAKTLARQSNATLLCYWLGRDRSYLWAVTPTAVTPYTLPVDTRIAADVDAYRQELMGDRGSLERSFRGELLYQTLVAPAKVPKGARVIVIADKKLHALNFETLIAPSPRRYWIEDVVVMNASSLQLLASGEPKATATPSLLLIGNAPSPDPNFRRLEYAAAEMSAVARRFERRVVLDGPKATPAAYRNASPEKFDYIHFVAHGVAVQKRPLDSAVILAPDASKNYKLLARDVVADPLRARLVTISSCHGAGTRTYAGEGVVGLAWAFLHAGAAQVIASLWEVSDAATPQLMDRMYANIRAGRDPAVALREAKLTLVRQKSIYRKPVYWAPFVLYTGT